MPRDPPKEAEGVGKAGCPDSVRSPSVGSWHLSRLWEGFGRREDGEQKITFSWEEAGIGRMCWEETGTRHFGQRSELRHVCTRDPRDPPPHPIPQCWELLSLKGEGIWGADATEPAHLNL